MKSGARRLNRRNNRTIEGGQERVENFASHAYNTYSEAMIYLFLNIKLKEIKSKNRLNFVTFSTIKLSIYPHRIKML